eukprot:COSAG01_NODE_568_length_15370_cov_26.058018_8_plen_239_part_00
MEANQAFQSGAFAYFTEPYTKEVLIKSIEDALYSSRFLMSLAGKLTGQVLQEGPLEVRQSDYIAALRKIRRFGKPLTLSPLLACLSGLSKDLKTSLIEAGPKEKEAHKKRKVLIIEDDEIILDNLSTLLSMVFDIEVAKTGREVVALGHIEDLELIILDIYLPDTMTTELIEPFKKEYPNVKIIIMTAYQDSKLAQECLSLGVDAYLNKPFPSLQMLTLIARSFQDLYFEKVLKLAEK